ncbi:AAA family ATPase [Bradyrhizobium sp. 139]|uniref:AAA family ATPase n=1 Tax=Bradyrhizobium sp. 139 TaxID=2782616 RepID=UPI001FF8F11C|nr:AAA family ATPase [Bradyrhizobium sp. 139]
MTLSPQQLAAALGGEVSGNEVLAPGPNHSRKDRSLSIKLDSTAPGGMLVHSFAHDDPLVCKDYVRERAGMAQWEPIKPKAEHIAPTCERVSGQVVAKPEGKPAAYTYQQADGSPYLRINRTANKRFWQEQWTGSTWIKGAPKGPKVLYRLPEMLAADNTTRILIVEGEKDADNLAALGYVATTNSGGAGKWTADLNHHMAGRDVYILPDNDEPGARHAKQVAAGLAGIARSIRIVHLPLKGDVSDWLGAGGTAEQLADILRIAPEIAPNEPAPSPITAKPYAWTEPETIPERQWLYDRRLLRKFLTATVAPGGVGKTNLEIAETLSMVSGKSLLGAKPAGLLRVWLWNLEDPHEEIVRRIQATARHYGLTPQDVGDRLYVNCGREQPLVIAETQRNGAVICRPVVDALVDQIRLWKIDVLIVDPYVSSHRVAENDNGAQEMVAKEWGRVADAGNCAVELVAHTRKGEHEVTTESTRGGKALTDACRTVRVVNRMTKDEAERAGVENPRLYFRTINDKANLTPPADKSDWFRLESVDLNNGPHRSTGDSVGVVAAWEWPDNLAGITGADFEKVAQAIRAGKWRESIQAKDWAGKAVAEALGLDLEVKAEKAKVGGMIKAWLVAGSLVVVQGVDEKRNPRKFIEVKET